MKQKLLSLLIILILTGCSPAAMLGTPTPITIPNVDPEGHLKQVDNRLIYNDWPLSLILPSDWPVENLMGEVLSDAALKSIFTRNALPGRDYSPTLTIILNKVPPAFDAARYSIAVQRQQKEYFSTIIKKSIEDEKVGLQNSIFYITSHEINGIEHTNYIVHATNNDVGVQVILEAETNALEDVSQEFDAILGSLKFEN